MSKLYVPPHVRAEAARDEAEMLAQIYEVESVLQYFNAMLKDIDPYLRMVKAKDQLDPGSPFKAGYYHVVRHEPGFMAYVTPLEHDNGTYREPGSWIFDHIAKEDLWNDRVMRDRKERERKLREAEQRQREREAQDRAGDFDERLAATKRTQILVKSKAW